MHLKPYKSLVRDKNGEPLTYGEILQSFEWREKREEIIIRDNRTYQRCHVQGPINQQGIQYRKLTKEEEQKYDYAEPIINDPLSGLVFYAAKPIAVPVENPIYLHVHHTYYILGKLPWEYSSDSLQTLCAKCREDLHRNEKICFYFDESKSTIRKLLFCARCSGTGYLEQFSYVDDGICFECKGNRFKNYNLINGKCY